MPGYKLASYQSDRGPRSGVIIASGLHDTADVTGQTSYATTLGVLEDWSNAQIALRDAVETLGATAGHPVTDVQLLAPILRPSAIYCAGANYSDHVANMAKLLNIPPEPDPHAIGLKPWHFLKPSGCLTGPDSTVRVDCEKLDWEAELTAVIGRTAKNISISDALNYVAGYTIANDLSARDLMRRINADDHSPFKYDWIGHKCFDGSCPLGPCIVPATDISDPQDLSIKLWVDGQIKQDSNTSRMIFTLAEQVSHLSSRISLYPGDLILTGTPAGVGAERGESLSPGQKVRIEIEKIGELTTTIG
jgi:2-keto-4-pentenoate hydratase/2-oxohepta-3-ene-1,7-dioic acid hydratase in catechol pathway